MGKYLDKHLPKWITHRILICLQSKMNLDLCTLKRYECIKCPAGDVGRQYTKYYNSPTTQDTSLDNNPGLQHHVNNVCNVSVLQLEKEQGEQDERPGNAPEFLKVKENLRRTSVLTSEEKEV